MSSDLSSHTFFHYVTRAPTGRQHHSIHAVLTSRSGAGRPNKRSPSKPSCRPLGAHPLAYPDLGSGKERALSHCSPVAMSCASYINCAVTVAPGGGGGVGVKIPLESVVRPLFP